MSKNQASEDIVHKAFDYVNQTDTWDIFCNTEGLEKLQIKFNYKKEL